MNTHCKSCCPSLYISCSCLGAKISSVVDFPFTIPNCASLALTMFLGQLSCTLSQCFMLWHISLMSRQLPQFVFFILEYGYQDAFSPYIWHLIISELVQKFTPFLPKLFHTSIGKLSGPVAMPFFMVLRAISISSLVISVMELPFLLAVHSFLPSSASGSIPSISPMSLNPPLALSLFFIFDQLWLINIFWLLIPFFRRPQHFCPSVVSSSAYRQS